MLPRKICFFDTQRLVLRSTQEYELQSVHHTLTASHPKCYYRYTTWRLVRSAEITYRMSMLYTTCINRTLIQVYNYTASYSAVGAVAQL